MELLQCGARLDAELLDKVTAGFLVRGERFCLSPRPVQREHQLAAEALAKRVVPDERFHLGNELCVALTFEVGVNAILERGKANLLEARRLVLRERLEREVGERWASPQIECHTELGSAFFRRPGLGSGDHPSEALEVELLRRDLQPVPGRCGSHHIGPQRLPELRDEVLQRGDGSRRRALSPQQVDQSVGRDDASGIQQQDCQDGALLGPPIGRSLPSTKTSSRAKDPELQHVTVVALSKRR